MNRVNDIGLPELFGTCRTIAVVGLSDDRQKEVDEKSVGGC